MVGQFMNIVTKSGGNTVHGSAAFFVIPQAFNASNLSGVAATSRQDYQPDTTLGGPIQKDRLWFFGSFLRIQRDQTFNNAPVPVLSRGNLWFVKGTAQLTSNQRFSVTFQYDKATQENAVIRGSVAPGNSIGSTSAGLSSGVMQITNPTAFGTLVKGGPLAAVNYNWVVSSTKMFQFVGSFMINKPNDYLPNGTQGQIVVRLVDHEAADELEHLGRAHDPVVVHRRQRSAFDQRAERRRIGDLHHAAAEPGGRGPDGVARRHGPANDRILLRRLVVLKRHRESLIAGELRRPLDEPQIAAAQHGHGRVVERLIALDTAERPEEPQPVLLDRAAERRVGLV